MHPAPTWRCCTARPTPSLSGSSASLTGTPYRSIDAYDIGISVSEVEDIPAGEFPTRKVLRGTSTGTKQQFYVLDLAERKSFPLDLLDNLDLNLSPDGQRLWAFAPQATGFAQLTFDPLQPTSLYTQQPIAYVHTSAPPRRGRAHRHRAALDRPLRRQIHAGGHAVRRPGPQHFSDAIRWQSRASRGSSDDSTSSKQATGPLWPAWPP